MAKRPLSRNQLSQPQHDHYCAILKSKTGPKSVDQLSPLIDSISLVSCVDELDYLSDLGWPQGWPMNFPPLRVNVGYTAQEYM